MKGISDYVELKCKTNFSFLRGASHPEELIGRAIDLGYKGLALNDKDGVYGIPKAYHYCRDRVGFKFIVGADLSFKDHPGITLLAKDRAAYGLLCRMITAAHSDKPKGEAGLTWPEFVAFMDEPRGQSLIALPDSPALVASARVPRYDLLKELFHSDNLYLPLSRFLDGRDKERAQDADEISRRYNIPVVATNDVHYHDPARSRLQDALTAIRLRTSLEKSGFQLFSNGERYLKTPGQMARLFKDRPEAIVNTLKIAEQCTFSPGDLRYRYPSEWIPPGLTAQTYLEQLIFIESRELYKDGVPFAIAKQIKHELALIEKLGHADYFLTIYEIVKFARSKKILCQGRGSAANSVVCYVLGITSVNPVKMDLLFERFMSANRQEPPDIDVDFEHERREEVIQHVYEKYGRHRAGMVSAVVKYRGKSALREMSKAMGIEVGTLSAKKLARDFEKLAGKTGNPRTKDLVLELSEEMNEFPRHLSIHSGGFTLSADPIIEIVPVEPARMEGRTIIQWDKYDLDYLNLLKVDLLSLGMLTALQKTLTYLKRDLKDIVKSDDGEEEDDPETYAMIQKADTVGTFQIESRAQMSMLGRLLPENFYDLVVQVAIVRPGPILGKMVHPYLERRKALKNGVRLTDKDLYIDPRVKPILKKTLGVPLFQEQVMKLSIELGGFSPGEADQLRRAIGAWRSNGSLDQIGHKLMAGLRKNGLPEEFVTRIFQQIRGFAEYGFPESHAASFARLAYVSAFLKCHHPAPFTASLINSQPMGFYSNHALVSDAVRHGVKVLPVDPNLSRWDCEILDDRRFRLGFRIVSGIREKDVKAMVEERDARPFRDLGDFLSRAPVSNHALLHLAMGGAFKSFGFDERHGLWRMLEYKMLLGQSDAEQLNLFAGTPLRAGPGDGPGDALVGPTHLFAQLTDFEKIKSEYEAYSLCLTGHPMSILRRENSQVPKSTSRDMKNQKLNTRFTGAGLVLVKQRPPTAKGTVFCTLEDEYGFIDLILHEKVFEKYEDVFLNNSFLKVTGLVQKDSLTTNLLVKHIEALRTPLEIENRQYFDRIRFN